jgi:hypothetical protein
MFLERSKRARERSLDHPLFNTAVVCEVWIRPLVFPSSALIYCLSSLVWTPISLAEQTLYTKGGVLEFMLFFSLSDSKENKQSRVTRASGLSTSTSVAPPIDHGQSWHLPWYRMTRMSYASQWCWGNKTLREALVLPFMMPPANSVLIQTQGRIALNKLW